MSVSLPTIDITFKQLASSFIERSERGNVLLILKDDTEKTITTKDYSLIADVTADAAKYTPTNLQYIKDAMVGLPNKVTVIRIDIADTIDKALAIASGYSTGWIGIAEGTTEEQGELATWIKQQRGLKKTIKGVVYKPATPPDSEAIVSLGIDKVTFNDSRGEQTGDKYIASLLGFLAGCNVEKGSTYLEMTNLVKVTAMLDADVNTALQAGKFMLINDEGKVRVGLGINSLTALGTDKTEDFKYIEVIETQDLILDDIRKTFKDNFIGKYRNTTDNQMLFISAANSYFRDLASSQILDGNYNNTSYIDTVAQKNAWIAVDPTAKDWNEVKVKSMPFKRQMFLGGNIKILQSMTDLSFNITMA
jgi:hypothetical protein